MDVQETRPKSQRITVRPRRFENFELSTKEISHEAGNKDFGFSMSQGENKDCVTLKEPCIQNLQPLEKEVEMDNVDMNTDNSIIPGKVMIGPVATGPGNTPLSAYCRPKTVEKSPVDVINMHFSHHTDKMNKFETLLENIKEETHKTFRLSC